MPGGVAGTESGVYDGVLEEEGCNVGVEGRTGVGAGEDAVGFLVGMLG